MEETQQATHRCLDGPLVVMDGWAEVRRWKELAAPLTGQPPACKGALEVEGSVYLEKRSMNEGRELGSDWQALTHLQIFSSFSFPP